MGRPAPPGKRRACPFRAGRAVSRRRSDFRRCACPASAPCLLAALLALGLAAALPAAAQIREGAYDVEGTNPDGTNYDGQFQLRTGPGGAWVANWRVANENIMGLGLIQAGVLAVSFVVNGRPGVAVFEVEPDGRLRGTWTSGGGLGTEMLTPK